MNYLSNYPWQEDHHPAESWEGLRHQLFSKRDDDDLAFPVDFWDRHDRDISHMELQQEVHGGLHEAGQEVPRRQRRLNEGRPVPENLEKEIVT